MIKGKVKILMVAAVIVAVVFMQGITSCKQNALKDNADVAREAPASMIHEQEVLDIQKAWGEGIVNIGSVYLENGDYQAAATQHIHKFYNYQEGTVLFKPTLTSVQQFRTDFQGALSYFVGGDENFPEDHGFAIKPWRDVRWENTGVKIHGDVAVAMGNYYFTPEVGGDEVKVEYSFAYVKNQEGELKIILHDSHLPYQPAENH